MHNINFLELSKVKIVKVVGIERDGRCIVADLVTSHFVDNVQQGFGIGHGGQVMVMDLRRKARLRKDDTTRNNPMLRTTTNAR